jgi:hypothetical protein
MSNKRKLAEKKIKEEHVERLKNYYSLSSDERERRKSNRFAIILIILFVIILVFLLGGYKK